MIREYKCKLYFALKAFTICFSVVLLMWGMAFILVRFMRFPPVFGIVVIISSMIIPFFFQKKIKSFFTKGCVLQLDLEKFVIITSNLSNHTDSKEVIYKWDQIKSYRFYFSTSKLTNLDICLKDGSLKEFGFIDNKNEEESIKGESVFSIFQNFINQYNMYNVENNKITFKPGFFATKMGLIVLYFIGVLLIIDVILYLIKPRINIGFLIMNSAIFLGLFARRKQQKDFYKKMNKLLINY